MYETTYALVNETTDSEDLSTTIDTTTEMIASTTLGTYNDTELRSGVNGDLPNDETTTMEISTEGTTLASGEGPSSKSALEPIKEISSEIEALLNRTREKDEDYEYDYNEPSLPPSLPNLRYYYVKICLTYNVLKFSINHSIVYRVCAQ